MTPLLGMMQSATTQRGTLSAGKRGDPTNNLTNLLITPPMLPSATGQHEIRQAIGMEGTAVQVFEVYTESHTHTDGGSSVTQMPDILEGDKLITGGVTYSVRFAEVQSYTSAFGETMVMYVTKDKRNT